VIWHKGYWLFARKENMGQAGLLIVDASRLGRAPLRDDSGQI